MRSLKATGARTHSPMRYFSFLFLITLHRLDYCVYINGQNIEFNHWFLLPVIIWDFLRLPEIAQHYIITWDYPILCYYLRLHVITQDYLRLPKITFYFLRLPKITLPEITCYYSRLPEITQDYILLPKITWDYQGLPKISLSGIMRDYMLLPEIDWDYMLLHEITQNSVITCDFLWLLQMTRDYMLLPVSQCLQVNHSHVNLPHSLTLHKVWCCLNIQCQVHDYATDRCFPHVGSFFIFISAHCSLSTDQNEQHLWVSSHHTGAL